MSKDKSVDAWITALKRDLELGTSDLSIADHEVEEQVPLPAASPQERRGSKAGLLGSRNAVSALSAWLASHSPTLATKSANSNIVPSSTAAVNAQTLAASQARDKIFVEFLAIVEETVAAASANSSASATTTFSDSKVLVCLAHLNGIAALHLEPLMLLQQYWSLLLRPVLLSSTRKDVVDLAKETILNLLSPSSRIPSAPTAASSQQTSKADARGPAYPTLSPNAETVFGSTVVICWMSEVERVWASLGDAVDVEVKRARANSPSRKGNNPDESSPLAIATMYGNVGLENVEGVIFSFAHAHPEEFVALIHEYCLQKERRLHALALLAKSIPRSNVIQTVALSSQLFATLATICLHDIHPASVAGALNILTLSLPYSIPNAASHLQTLFLILLRCIHWEVLNYIVFRVIAPFVDGESGATEQETISPWSVDIEMEDLDKVAWGQTSLMMSISSDVQDDGHQTPPPNSFFQASKNPTPLKAPSPDYLLLVHMAGGVRRSADLFFTILYGLFPHSTLTHLKDNWASFSAYSYQTSLPDPPPKDTEFLDAPFEALPDPFGKVRRRILDVDSLDISELLYKRLEHILSSHRLHPNAVRFSSPDYELRYARSHTFSYTNPPSELIGQGLSLRIPKVQRLAPAVPRSPTSSMDEGAPEPGGLVTVTPDTREGSSGTAAREVLVLNRKLREYMGDLTPSGHSAALDGLGESTSTRHTVPYPVVELMRIHQLLLVNEINVECTLRSELLESSKLLRKQMEINQAIALDRESVYQKLKQQQHELTTLNATVDQLKAEASATRERYRKYEEDFNRRLKTAKEAAKASKDELVEANASIASSEERIVQLTKEREEAFARVSELENERQVSEPSLAKLAEYEQTVKALTEQLSRYFDRANSESSTIAELTDKNASLELMLEETNRELSETNIHLQEKQRLLDEQSAKITLLEQQAEDQLKTSREQERIVKSLRADASSRAQILEDKYQTLKKVNEALEDRIVDLQSGK
ncbi:hypothetical protein HDU97_006195 [Phlyctochytrium planicorne]|nr:hypothetical protein HDU97_006195 [Phlyctochytrium planicorne]